MSKAPRGRRVPPKARGPRTARPAGDFDGIDGGAATGDTAAGSASAAAEAARRTRAQNRAAKRAAGGVSPKKVRAQTRAKRGSNAPLIALAVAAVAVGAAVILLGNPFGAATASPSPSAAATAPSYGDGTCPTSQPAALGSGVSKLVTLKTEKGDIVIKVDGVLSPIAAGNFVALAQCKFYDGVVFHRTATIGGSTTPFVIQGGDPTGTGSGNPGYFIKDEPVTTTYKRGTVAMARSSQPNSQGSQFFIVLTDESGPILQSNGNNYAIFGNVVSGMEVADAIYAASNGEELPTDPVAMTSVTVADVPASPSPGASAAPTAAPTTAPTTAPSATPEPPPAHEEQPMTRATIATELGDIEVDLFTQAAPKATQNFIDLANKGFYDDVIFHRVIPGFVIQGGDGEFGKKSALNGGRVGTGGPGYKFEDEPVHGDYGRGSLAMANSGPNTNGSQFFICVADLSGRLPKNYTLFGQVTKGLDIVDQIVGAPRNARDLPDAPVAMTKVTIHED